MKATMVALAALMACGGAAAARGPMGTPGHGGFVSTSTKPSAMFTAPVGVDKLARRGGGRKGGKFGK